MIVEAFSIPILLKATEFLFNEAGKILQERRERRQAEEKPFTQEIETLTTLSQDSEQAQDTLTSKEVAITQMIDENSWENSRAEIEHLISLLEIHTRNYYLAQKQYAKWGSALVPPIIMNNLDEAEDEVAKTTIKLQNALSKVYGKRIAIPEAGGL